MKTIDFWFDPISPYAYLAFEQLPTALEGSSYNVVYRPILFGALLRHWDHKGPAEIEPKRAFTFRQVQWLADRAGVALQTPAEHPFNPLALLRLAHACAGPGEMPNRHVCAAILHHVWRGEGASANAPERLAELTKRLAPTRDPGSDAVKAALKEATDDAIGRGRLRRAHAGTRRSPLLGPRFAADGGGLPARRSLVRYRVGTVGSGAARHPAAALTLRYLISRNSRYGFPRSL